MSATRNAQFGGYRVVCSVAMIWDESFMYDGICIKYFCSFRSSRTEVAYVGVPIEAQTGRSLMGGYILCSLGLP